MRFLLILLVFTIIRFVTGCPNGNCAWKNVCNNGEDLDCMDRVSGVLKCQDRHSVCQSFNDCDSNDAALRAGNTCNEFPYYNGGFPIGRIGWNVENGKFSCTNISSNGVFCENWQSIDYSSDTIGISASTCIEPSVNLTFCESWSTSQHFYSKCFQSHELDQTTGEQKTICCNKDNIDDYVCCNETCSLSSYTLEPKENMYSSCSCQLSSSNGNYCQQWSCETFSDSTQTFASGREFEKYICTQTTNSLLEGGANISDSLGYEYCTQWSGSSESRKAFELSQCQCEFTSSYAYGTFCNKWQCTTKGMRYHWPNTLWVLFPIFIAAIPQLVLVYFYHKKMLKFSFTCEPSRKDHLRRWQAILLFCLLFIWVLPMSIIAISKAGLVSLFFVTIPVFLITFVVLAGPYLQLIYSRLRSFSWYSTYYTFEHSRCNIVGGDSATVIVGAIDDEEQQQISSNIQGLIALQFLRQKYATDIGFCSRSSSDSDDDCISHDEYSNVSDEKESQYPVAVAITLCKPGPITIHFENVLALSDHEE